MDAAAEDAIAAVIAACWAIIIFAMLVVTAAVMDGETFCADEREKSADENSKSSCFEPDIKPKPLCE